jgi:uncharacterized protein
MVAKSAHHSGNVKPAMVSSVRKQSQKVFFSTRILYSLYASSRMKSQQHQLTLELLLRQFSVCRLPANTAIPQWATRGMVSSITRTADELSIVCESRNVPGGVESEKGFRCFKLAGPFPFAMTGVLASVLEPLAKTNISIFAISTYDTDYVMVKETSLPKAIGALRAAGHEVVTP